MSEYKRAPELDRMLERVVSIHLERFEKISGATILCLALEERRKKDNCIKWADCEKVKDKLRAVTGLDFIITFYLDALLLPVELQERVMFHELLHVGYDAETESRWIKPHDLQDFRACVELWGLDWISGDQNPPA